MDLQQGQGHCTPDAEYLASHITSVGFSSLKSKVETIPISTHLPGRCGFEIQMRYSCI